MRPAPAWPLQLSLHSLHMLFCPYSRLYGCSVVLQACKQWMPAILLCSSYDRSLLMQHSDSLLGLDGVIKFPEAFFE
jgi:hypothetical protein